MKRGSPFGSDQKRKTRKGIFPPGEDFRGKSLRKEGSRKKEREKNTSYSTERKSFL